MNQLGTGKTVTISLQIAGTAGLTKAGVGTLVLNGAPTPTPVRPTIYGNGTVSANNIVVSGGASNLGNAASAVTLGDATTKGTLAYTGNSATYTRGFTIGKAAARSTPQPPAKR